MIKKKKKNGVGDEEEEAKDKVCEGEVGRKEDMEEREKEKER